MVEIFNTKLDHAIIINNQANSWIFVHPFTYLDKPFIEVKIVTGFNFFHHKNRCTDCNALWNAFGTNTLDWYLKLDDKTYRLDLSNFENVVKYNINNGEDGTIFHFRLSDIPIKIDELILLQAELVNQENYEDACIIRDLINEGKIWN